MDYSVLEKLRKEPKYLNFLRENSMWYKELNRDPKNYDLFIKEMKIKYRLRTIDKIDNVIEATDLITKFMSVSKE